MGLTLDPSLSIPVTPLCASGIPRLHIVSISLHDWTVKKPTVVVIGKYPDSNEDLHDPDVDEQNQDEESFDEAALRSHIMSLLHGHLLTPNRILVFDFHLKLIRAVVESIAFPVFPDSCEEIEVQADMGVMTGNTKICFVESDDAEQKRRGWESLRLRRGKHWFVFSSCKHECVPDIQS